jgi:hypothetical protein
MQDAAVLLRADVVQRLTLRALDEHAKQLSFADALGQRLGAPSAQQTIRTVTAERQLSFRRSMDDCACPRDLGDDLQCLIGHERNRNRIAVAEQGPP